MNSVSQLSYVSAVEELLKLECEGPCITPQWAALLQFGCVDLHSYSYVLHELKMT